MDKTNSPAIANPDRQAIADELHALAADLAGCAEICHGQTKSNAVELVGTNLDRINHALCVIALNLETELAHG